MYARRLGSIALLTALCSGLACSKDSNPVSPPTPNSPPQVYDAQWTPGPYGVTISWRTSEDTRYELFLEGYSDEPVSASPVNIFNDDFSISLTGLNPETTYEAILRVYDRENLVREEKYTFRTTYPPDTDPPDITAFNLETGEDVTPFINFSYTTNEPTQDSIAVTSGNKTYTHKESSPRTSHSFTFEDPPADTSNISVTAFDAAGNSSKKDTTAALNAAVKYGLIVRGPNQHDWGIEDSNALKTFLEEWGYDVKLLHLPSASDLSTAIDDIKQKTDSNDEVVFNVTCHGTWMEGKGTGKINMYFRTPSVPAEQVTNQWNNDNYRRLMFLPLISYAKTAIDRTSMPRSVSISPVWDNESPAQPFFYNNRHSSPMGIIPEVAGNPTISLGELFNSLYSDFSALSQLGVQYHPFIGVKEGAEPAGEYTAYSDYEGNIIGSSPLLDEKAFRKPELKEN